MQIIWTIAGTIPEGILSLDNNKKTITVNPTTSGTFNFNLRVNYFLIIESSKSFSITIA